MDFLPRISEKTRQTLEKADIDPSRIQSGADLESALRVVHRKNTRARPAPRGKEYLSQAQAIFARFPNIVGAKARKRGTGTEVIIEAADPEKGRVTIRFVNTPARVEEIGITYLQDITPEED